MNFPLQYSLDMLGSRKAKAATWIFTYSCSGPVCRAISQIRQAKAVSSTDEGSDERGLSCRLGNGGICVEDEKEKEK